MATCNQYRLKVTHKVYGFIFEAYPLTYKRAKIYAEYISSDNIFVSILLLENHKDIEYRKKRNFKF